MTQASDLSHKLATLRIQREPKARCQPKTNAWIKPMAGLLEDHSHHRIAVVLDWVYDYGNWAETAKTPAIFKAHFYSIDEAMKIERACRRSWYDPLLVALRSALRPR